MTLVGCWTTAIVLIAVGTATGRLLVGAAARRLLAAFQPESAAASLLLGAAAWVVGFARLSSAGFTAPQALGLLLVAHVPLALVASWRGRLHVLVPRGRPETWLGLGAAIIAAVFVALLPVQRTGGFAINNDTFIYCAVSEWLQDHGFGTPVRWEADAPLLYFPALWQDTSIPEESVREAPTLGAAFLLALVQAATGARPSLAAFPPTAAFAMGLATAGLFLLARWGARLARGPALLATLAFATLPHPLFWGHHNGFLQQSCGVAALLLGVGLAARCRTRPSLESAAFVALAAAFLLVVYLPLLPFLALAGGVLALAWLRRGLVLRRPGASLAAIGVGVALVALLAWREVSHGLWRLPQLSRIVAGWHVDFGARDFLAFAMGASAQGVPMALPAAEWIRPALLWLGPLWAGSALAGLLVLGRKRRFDVLLALVGLFAATYFYFRFFVADPWTGLRGQTWSLFRLVQWAYPFTLVLQAAGLAATWRALTPRGRRGLAALALVPVILLYEHWEWSRPLGLGMRRIVDSPAPLRDLPEIREGFASLPPGTLLLVGRAANRHLWLGAYTSLLAYPRRIVGDWEGSAGIPPAAGAALYRDVLGRIGEPGIVPIVGAARPFSSPALEPLGGGFARITSVDKPLVIYVASPQSRLFPHRGASFQVGYGRSKVVVLTTARTTANLVLQAAPGRTAEPPISLDVFSFPADLTNPLPRRAIEAAEPVGELRCDGNLWTVPVPLEPGVNTVVLTPERRSATPAMHRVEKATIDLGPPTRVAMAAP